MRIDAATGFYTGCMAFRPSTSQETVEVFLDEVRQSNVIVADEEAGALIRVCVDHNGDVMVDGDAIRYEEVRGVVRIELPDWWPVHLMKEGA